jgi:hypothetical protein
MHHDDGICCIAMRDGRAIALFSNANKGEIRSAQQISQSWNVFGRLPIASTSSWMKTNMQYLAATG